MIPVVISYSCELTSVPMATRPKTNNSNQLDATLFGMSIAYGYGIFFIFRSLISRSIELITLGSEQWWRLIAASIQKSKRAPELIKSLFGL
jgi:hypothetical protein